MTSDAQTLVLDVGFQPINRTTMKRAVLLLLKGRAEVVEEYDRTIWAGKEDKRTATKQFQAPSVIRLIHNVASHSKYPRFNRHNIWLRDKGRCQYCGTKCPLDGEGKFTYDHVIPAAMGGTRRWENIVVACYDCNQRKGGRTPDQAKMRLLSRPVRPRSLPGAAQGRGFSWSAGMPNGWKQWLRDTLYWHDDLQ